MTNSADPKKGIEGVIVQQKERSNSLFKPLQEQLRSQNEPIKHHPTLARGNPRNKFARMNEVRQRHRMDVVALKREKVWHQRDTKEAQLRLEQESALNEVELEKLLDEERELEIELQREAAMKELEEYERELEESFAEMLI